MEVKYWLLVGSAIGFSTLLALCIIIIIAKSKTYPLILRSKKEKFFHDPISGKNIEFPSIDDKPTINLSVVVPAYNEEKRLPPMLDECLEFLEDRCKTNPQFSYEIIIVSDGSTDNTVNEALKYSKKYGCEKVRVLELETNRGKGGAVRLGILSTRGALVLFADADGATKFADLSRLENGIKNSINADYLQTPSAASEKLAISVGSRAHLEDEAVARRTLFRAIISHGLHFHVWLLLVRGIRDTQCGFKLLTRKAARACFDSMHIEKWAFDIELLYIAQTLKIPISEVAVNWAEIDGSKMTTTVWNFIGLATDLIVIWLRYTVGAWKIKCNNKQE